jgi:hypothetical protein
MLMRSYRRLLAHVSAPDDAGTEFNVGLGYNRGKESAAQQPSPGSLKFGFIKSRVGGTLSLAGDTA